MKKLMLVVVLVSLLIASAFVLLTRSVSDEDVFRQITSLDGCSGSDIESLESVSEDGSASDYNRGYAYNRLYTCSVSAGDLDSAKTYIDKSIEYFEKSGDTGEADTAKRARETLEFDASIPELTEDEVQQYEEDARLELEGLGLTQEEIDALEQENNSINEAPSE